MSSGSSTSDRTTLAAFGAFVVLAGRSVIAVRSVSCEECELEPFWAAAMRLVLAALILGAVRYGVSGAPDIEPGRVASEP